MAETPSPGEGMRRHYPRHNFLGAGPRCRACGKLPGHHLHLDPDMPRLEYDYHPRHTFIGHGLKCLVCGRGAADHPDYGYHRRQASADAKPSPEPAQAFPEVAERPYDDMTLREWFVGQALASMQFEHPAAEFVAERAVKIADAILAKLKKPRP
jgi:hypothetical protein